MTIKRQTLLDLGGLNEKFVGYLIIPAIAPTLQEKIRSKVFNSPSQTQPLTKQIP
jgi:hypothetical protein